MTASLGWGLLDLADELLVPSGEFYGRPLTLTDEQAQAVLDWYAVDEHGRFIHRRGALRRPKGWGKSPFAAFMAYCELVGPVRFLEWDGAEPVGRPCPSPWVQIAAVSEDQTDNTYVALYEMLRESDAVHRFGLDVGLTRIYRSGTAGRIEPVTASAGSREGQPVTFAVLDQTESWTKSNGGVRLAATLRRNAAKMGGRTFETPNAHTIGDGTVAEETFKAWEKGAAGLWYDFSEAPDVEDLHDHDAVVEALKVSYRDSSAWAPLDRLADECADPANEPADIMRFYFNRPATETNRAVDMRRWAGLVRPDRMVQPGERIGVGFDGSISNDMTVLWGCTEDRFLFEIAAWGRPAGAAHDWRVPRHEVHETLAEVFARYDVGMMLADPPQWHSEVEEWERLYGDVVVSLPTNSAAHFAPACDLFATSVREGSVSHDGSELLTRHLAATARKKVRVNDDDEDGRSRFVFVKAATAKIDATVGAVLALRAAVMMPADSAIDPAANVW